MNFSASRLGFWYNKPPDRGYKKKVLVFYDPLTDGPGGNTNYYNTSGDINPATVIYPIIQAREAVYGLTTTLVQSYADLNTLNLSEYAHIWDIGYASPYASNPDNPTSKLYGYLQSGGSLFDLGENSNFGVRDDTIDTFISGIGGGTVTRKVTSSYSVSATVFPEFLLANNNTSIVFSRPGAFTNFGTGTVMTTGITATEYVAVMWKTNSLVGAPSGAIISILDINFFAGFNKNIPFVDNLILSLNRK